VLCDDFYPALKGRGLRHADELAHCGLSSRAKRGICSRSQRDAGVLADDQFSVALSDN